MSWKSSAEPLARREVEIRLQRYKEFLDYARKKQNYSTAYGLLTKFLTLDYPILWAGIAWRLLREICVSSRRQQLLPPRGSKFRVVMARCQNL